MLFQAENLKHYQHFHNRGFDDTTIKNRVPAMKTLNVANNSEKKLFPEENAW